MRLGLALLISILALSSEGSFGQEKPEEAAATAKIKALGGTIERKNAAQGNNQFIVIDLIANEKLKDEDLECLKAFNNLAGLYLGRTGISDAGMRSVGTLEHLTVLGLAGTKITDAGLKELGGLQELQGLILGDTAVTDRGLRELARLQNLQRLTLAVTVITDAGLVELGKIPRLANLNLNGTKITDAGLAELGKLTQLTMLDLSETNITDAGLKNLQGLKNLRMLVVVETKVTDAGIKDLRIALPNARITRQTLGQRSDPDFDISVAKPAYTQKHPTVLFDEAHKNFHTASGRYKVFADLITNDGYRVTPNKEPFTKECLANCDLLITANAPGLPPGAKSAFTEAECAAVEKWVRDGGALLLITDHEPFGSGSEELGKRFGVNMSLLVSVDPENTVKDNILLFSRAKNQLGEHPIMRGRDESERVHRVLTFTGQSLLGPPGSVPLLKFADTAMDEGQDKRISAKGRSQGLALKFGKGRVVVMGEAGDLSAQVYGDPPEKMGMNVPGCDNRKMALNIVHWLSGLIE